MSEENVFQRPETVPIWVEIKNWATPPIYVDPSEGVSLTLSNPSGVEEFTASAMTKTATGKYVYYFNSELTDDIGWWKTVATAQDGTGAGAKYTIVIGGFTLQ